MKKVFILGLTGMDGSTLADLHLEQGDEVHGIIRRSSSINTRRIDHIMESDLHGTRFFTYHGDITDPHNINNLISKIKPDLVYNEAAQSHVKVSFEIPAYTTMVDGLGALYVLEAVRQHAPECRILQASTSEMYGGQLHMKPEKGWNEESPFYPRSPYGCAKVYGFWITKNYREAYNLFAANSICFNHEGPRRGETFVTRKITKWCGANGRKLINGTSVKPLELGNLHAARDWGHSIDFCRAMMLVLNHKKAEDWVIATGETHTVKEFVNKCFEWLELELEWEGEGINEIAKLDGQIVVKVNPKYFRPTEVDYLLGDAAKLKTKLGWIPEYSFSDLVHQMMKTDMVYE